MKINLFKNLTEEHKQKCIDTLITHSTADADFFIMIILAVAMATFGVIIDNIPVVIGSMLIAPMLYPILATSLGIVIADNKAISRSFLSILSAIGISLVVATIIGLFFGRDLGLEHNTILNNVHPTIITSAIAIIAGFAGTFAMLIPSMNETLPGVAIAVTLIPPLSIAGIGIANFDWSLIASSLLIFLINVIGIIFAGMIVFSLMRFYDKREFTKDVIKETENQM